MSILTRHLAVLALCTTTAACSGAPYDEGWGTDDITTGKADGIADGAIELQLGSVHEGFVDEQSMVLYKVRLRRGDRLRARKDVVSGDLAPHFALVHNLTESIGSIEFDVTDTSLEKTFEVKVTGNYLFMVRAFGNRGKGDYQLKVDCTGGPCNGEFPAEFLEADDADLCLEKAQACAFDRMARFNGAVGPARAAALLDECLGTFGTADGASCLEACEKQPDHGAESADRVCDDLVRDLQFYADQTSECLEVVSDCMSLCSDLGERTDGGELLGQPFATCWSLGLNSTCPRYAREVTECGGQLDRGSEAECQELCQASDGAFTQDVARACDDICL